MTDERIDYADDLRNALDMLRRGGVILYPTDTVWGLGCDATDSKAVARIYELKQRAESKSMLTKPRPNATPTMPRR